MDITSLGKYLAFDGRMYDDIREAGRQCIRACHGAFDSEHFRYLSHCSIFDDGAIAECGFSIRHYFAKVIPPLLRDYAPALSIIDVIYWFLFGFKYVEYWHLHFYQFHNSSITYTLFTYNCSFEQPF